MQNIILTFKDQQYPLDKVLAKGKSGPVIEAKPEEVNVSEEALAMVKLSAATVEVMDGSIIFFKHEGKYLVIAGIATAMKALAKGSTVKGHLLTTVMLKTVRIEKPMAESAKVQAVSALQDRFSSARPSSYNSTPRTSYDNDRSYPRSSSGKPVHSRSK